MASSRLKIKLLIDAKERKVLFAEAGKDVVDFLLYLLSLPLATVVKLLKEKGMVGTLCNLYGSVENLNETYFQKKESKESVLNYASPLNNVNEIPLLLSYHKSTTRKFYSCNSYGTRHYYVADVHSLNCPDCASSMTRELSFVSPTTANVAGTGGTTTVTEGGGFVKGVVTYMIMDNLEVSPMSTISSITLLNKFNVKNVGGLEEKIVYMGMNEGLKLLKASLECDNVLTEVFLVKKRIGKRGQL